MIKKIDQVKLPKIINNSFLDSRDYIEEFVITCKLKIFKKVNVSEVKNWDISNLISQYNHYKFIFGFNPGKFLSEGNSSIKKEKNE